MVYGSVYGSTVRVYSQCYIYKHYYTTLYIYYTILYYTPLLYNIHFNILHYNVYTIHYILYTTLTLGNLVLILLLIDNVPT